MILSVEGHKVLRPEDLARSIATFQPGDRVTLEVLHDGDREEVEVTLGKRPDRVPGG